MSLYVCVCVCLLYLHNTLNSLYPQPSLVTHLQNARKNTLLCHFLGKDQYFPYEIYRNDTTGRTVYKQEQTYYSAEELMAMMLQYAKQITKNHGYSPVTHYVLACHSLCVTCHSLLK